MSSLNDKKLSENILVKIDLALKNTTNVPSRKLSFRPLKSIPKAKSMRPIRVASEVSKTHKDLE